MMERLIFISALLATLSVTSYCQSASDSVIHNYLRQFETPSFTSYQLTFESIPVIDKVDFYKNDLKSKHLVYEYYKQNNQNEIFRIEYFTNNEPGVVGILTEEKNIYFEKKSGFYHEANKEEKEKFGNIEYLKLCPLFVSKLVLNALNANKIKFTMEAQFEGRACFKFEYQAENQDVLFFYFNKYSFELYAVVFSEGNFRTYENYKPINGLVIPTLVTGFVKSERRFIFSYSNFELDIEISSEVLLEGEEGLR